MAFIPANIPNGCALYNWMHPGRNLHTVRWSDTAVVADKNLNKTRTGLFFRPPVSGPEKDMVDSFLNMQQFILPSGKRLCVFCEPALQTGFPDIVAVIWDENVMKEWPAERLDLTVSDLRLLHLMVSRGWLSHDYLTCYAPNGLKKSLLRLEMAGVIQNNTNKCRIKSLKKIFAVDRIIAIEAKTACNVKVLQQACGNTWFSSESHALFPFRKPEPSLKRQAVRFGVGLLGFTDNGVTELSEPKKRDVPLSYGSWLFNEWIWRLGFVNNWWDM
jgi:hypothetical protein